MIINYIYFIELLLAEFYSNLHYNIDPLIAKILIYSNKIMINNFITIFMAEKSPPYYNIQNFLCICIIYF